MTTGKRMKEGEEKGEEKIPAVPISTLATPRALIEECWDGKRLVLQKTDFSTGRDELFDEINAVDDLGRPIRYVPMDNETLRGGAVLLPAASVGYQATFAGLWGKADALLKLAYDAGEESDYAKLLMRVVTSSWWLGKEEGAVAGMSRFAPIIPIRGLSGGGKGRLSNVFRFCAYHPLIMMRTFRLPSMYRNLHMWRGVLFIDEGDVAGWGTSEIGTYLLERSYGIPIIRVNPENINVSQTFDNFQITVLTQREDFGDNALEGRSLPYVTEKTDRQLPTLETEEMIELGREIQRDLLSLRCQFWNRITVDQRYWFPGITDARLNAALLPLHAVSEWSPELSTLISAHLKRIEDRKIKLKAESDDGILINFLYEKVNTGLFRKKSANIFYFLEKIEKGLKEEDVEVTLTSSMVKDALLWESAAAIRKKLRNLLNVDESFKVGGQRAIAFKPRIICKLFKEFVPGFDPKTVPKEFETDGTLWALSQPGGTAEEKASEDNPPCVETAQSVQPAAKERTI